MFKKIFKKVTFLCLMICLNMFILSSASLMVLKAAIPEPITPNGSYVPYQSITTDLSNAKKSEYISNESKYVSKGAILLDEPTNRYNSHSYAWYQQLYSSNIYKITDPSVYFNDGSYRLKTDGIEVGDIVCYYRVKLTYNSKRTELVRVDPYLAHSAKVKSINGDFDVYNLESLENLTLISKWGDGGLYEHLGNNCPYYYDCLHERPSTLDNLHFDNMNIETIDDALFYIEVYGPNYDSSISIDLSENPIVLSKNLESNHFVFYKLNVLYAGRFEITVDANDLVDLKVFAKDLRLINYVPTRDEDGKTKIEANLYTGIYYIRVSYLNSNSYGNTVTSIKRIISNNPDNENAIIPDHNYIDECGSEVTINKGNYGGNTVTQGFTRILYLDTSVAPSASRLDYYWYSSNDDIATISKYATLFAKDGTDNKTVDIIAVYKKDPSKIYKKSFIIKEETKTDEIIINYELTIPVNTTVSLELDNKVPYNWIQCYTWSTDNKYIATISSFGTIKGIGKGQTTLTGRYKYNNRVSVIITIHVI